MAAARQAHALASRVVATTARRLAAFALIATATAWATLGQAARTSAFRDAQLLLAYEADAVQTVRRFAEAPLWDPWICGGVYALGSPQTRFASPTFLLSLVLGAGRAEPLIAVLLMTLGLEGMFRYARARGAGGLGAFAAAPIFALGGNFATPPFLGWTHFYGFELLPFAALAARRLARGDTRAVAWLALVLAALVGFGGTYAAPMCCVLVAWELASATVTRLGDPRRVATTLVLAAATGALAAGTAALRLWPIAETLHAAPRIVGGAPSFSLDDVARALFAHFELADGEVHQNRGLFYVGALGLPVALLGALRLRARAALALALVATWTATGYALGRSPFTWLRALPAFDALRYPERYLVLASFALATLAAYGARRLEARARSSRPARLAFAAALVALAANAVDLAANHVAVARARRFDSPPRTIERDFHQARGNRWALAQLGPSGRGSISCWDAWPVPESPALRGDLEHEAYLVESGAGSVVERAWSPERVVLHVALTRPARLRVNQNHHVGWRASVGAVVSDEGLLAVELPAGEHDLTLAFSPRSAKGGLAATLAGLAVAFALARRRAKDGPRPALSVLGLALGPLAVAAIAFAGLDEPAIPRAPARTPAGEPVLVDAPAADARDVGTLFEGGARLVAARLEPRVVRPGGATTLELDFESGPDVGRAIGVFVHAEPPRGAAVRADHTHLSGAVRLHDVPRGAVARDVVPLRIPADAAEGPWTVWVGLWNATGTGERVRVAAPGRVVVDDDRVRIAAFFVGGSPSGPPRALPTGAARLDVAFDAGVTLVGASLASPWVAPGGALALDLYWRAERPLAAGTGAFVHVDRGGALASRGDHEAVDGERFFEELVPGALVRDRVLLPFEPTAAPGAYSVRAGLWKARAGGERHRVTEAGAATIDDDRVELGTVVVR